MPETPEKVELAQSLQAMDLARLKAIADHLGLDSSFASRARLLEEIPSALALAPFDVLIDGIGRADRYKLLALITLEMTADIVGKAYFDKAAGGLYGETLASRGLAVKDTTLGRPRVPLELMETLAAGLARSYKLPSVKAPDTPINLSSASAVVDLTTLWAETLKRPIPLTKTGLVSRRSLGRIMPLMSVDEEEPPLYDVFATFGASRLDMLVNYALVRLAVVRRGGELTGNPDYLADVLSGFPGLSITLLSNVPTGAGGAAAAAVFALRKHPKGEWFRYSYLVRVARRANGETGAETAGRVACALFVVGILEAGFVNGDLVLSRVSDIEDGVSRNEPTDSNVFHVGGNFEVQVPADIGQDERLKLEAFADLRSSGHYLTYVIGRESFYRALDDGLPADEIKRFLADRSAKELPQNLVFSLDDWAERYGEVGFVEGTFLAAKDATRLEEIAKVTELTGELGKPVDLCGFRIPASDYETIYGRLIEAGFLPATLDAWREPRKGNRARLFRGDTAPDVPVPRSSAVPTAEMLRSAVAFASENGRPVRFYLSGGETVEGVPGKVRGKSETSFGVDVDGEVIDVKTSEVEGFEFV
ncbi:MAG: helicase-associated domain-containing protein [Candidatus Coatesbacteria bacterium]|nr:MAG: helicase-associated domain-containing protein [Candidatus Coatesbacteria bacterium]